jgi:hypothetical protein
MFVNFTEMYWTLMHRWAENAGLDVIACVAPRFIEAEPKAHSQHPAGAIELLSFGDRMGYNASWQLGYGRTIEKHQYFKE